MIDVYDGYVSVEEDYARLMEDFVPIFISGSGPRYRASVEDAINSRVRSVDDMGVASRHRDPVGWQKGLWATKLAVACGNSESISKLFSTQRRRIYALEQRTAEAQMNNEALSDRPCGPWRLHPWWSAQVRRQTAEPEAGGAASSAPAPAPALVEDKEVGRGSEASWDWMTSWEMLGK
eukprot:Skav200620  [mRNA]  locus=scaffold2029:19856:24304:+ [translate_table: standard]